MAKLTSQQLEVLKAVTAGVVYRVEPPHGGRDMYQSYRADRRTKRGDVNATRQVEKLSTSVPPLIRLGDRDGQRRRWCVTADGKREIREYLTRTALDARTHVEAAVDQARRGG